MQPNYLIKGGTVVDGTGKPAYVADVRVHGRLIVEIAPSLDPEPRERVVDATDCYVAPGFIESHNHFDGPMWWMPAMEPMSGYGVTTSVNGNCGFSAAPIHTDPALRSEMIQIFSFFEDIPEAAFNQILPWDWSSWSEYKLSVERHLKLAVNFAAYCGHIALRLAVMGLEAWERAATPEEIVELCDLLDDALTAGALGLSSNLMDADRSGRLVPSQHADDEEFGALMDVIARHPGTSMQVIVDIFFRNTFMESVERIGELARVRGVRVQIPGGVPSQKFQSHTIAEALALHEKQAENGSDVWVGFHHLAPTIVIGFSQTLLFAQSGNLVWHEIIAAPSEEEKLALLADPGWRERARASWDQMFDNFTLKHAESVLLFETETFVGPTGITLAEYKSQRSITHTSDALAEWLLDNGLESTIKLADWDRHEETILKLFRDPKALGNLSDAGAHGKMLCAVGDNVLILTKYVRDTGYLTIEEAIHILTGKAADLFGLGDRGVLAVGKVADIVVFDLAEIERRPQERIYDVPDGEGGRTYRYTRPAAPMRLTLVAGVPTFDHGAFTGKFPGRCIGPVSVDT